MAKRFTDTDKWKKPFIRGLQGPYKLLWMYILDDCDHAGIWQVDFDVAQIRIGEKLSIEVAIKVFGERVDVFDGGSKWFIPDFISFQYGELNPKNRMHLSVINILTKHKVGAYKPLGRGQGIIQGKGNGQGTIHSDNISSKEQAWKELTSDELLIEDAKITMTQKGWRNSDTGDIMGIIKTFIAKSEMPVDRDEFRKHWRNWLLSQPNEKLIEYGRNFKRQSA